MSNHYTCFYYENQKTKKKKKTSHKHHLISPSLIFIKCTLSIGGYIFYHKFFQNFEKPTCTETMSVSMQYICFDAKTTKTVLNYHLKYYLSAPIREENKNDAYSVPKQKKCKDGIHM